MTTAEPPDLRSGPREAVLMSGMLRSGAAAASRSVSFLGYSQPLLLAQPVPAHPTGAWESTRIVQLNEEMIASLGWSWDHTPLLMRPGLSPAEAESEILAHLSSEWLERARDAIRCSFREDARRVVCKDPRLSLFPAFWQAAFEAEDFQVKHLLAFRHPEDVVRSVLKHQGMGRAAALRAWLAYNLRPLTQVQVAATLDFDDLVTSPSVAVDRVADGLEVSRLDPAAAVELEEYIDRALPEAAGGEAGEGRLPGLVLQTWRLLRAWRRGPDEIRERRAEVLRQDMVDGQLLFGRTRRLPPLPTSSPVYTVHAAPAGEAADPADTADRALVIHYHLFKNAGSSVDVVLEGNFGPDWREVEFSNGHAETNVAEVGAWIAAHPSAKALSSQSALGPLPKVPGVAIAPVIFIRHPIDRLRSGFEFERRRKGEGQPGRTERFDRYVEGQLQSPPGQVHNFQTCRLASLGSGEGSDARRARRALDELPFVGLVEDFAGSMTRMETYLRQYFPQFRAFGAKANVWREGRTLEERLDDVRAELGPALWRRLIDANREDLDLFAAVAERYGLPVDAVLPE